MTDMELGGHITLAGFKDVSKAELVVVKKVVGSYARKLSDGLEGFENLKVTLKVIHKTEASEKYELNAKVIAAGEHYEAEEIERNIFVALDAVLQKVTEHAFRQLEKQESK